MSIMDNGAHLTPKIRRVVRRLANGERRLPHFFMACQVDGISRADAQAAVRYMLKSGELKLDWNMRLSKGET